MRACFFAMLCLVLSGCGDDSGSAGDSAVLDTSADTGGGDTSMDAAVPGPDGALGVCCPIVESCDCTPKGGWAPSLAECTGPCDVAPGGTTEPDEWGCPVYSNSESCNAPDAGIDRFFCATETCARGTEYCTVSAADGSFLSCSDLPEDCTMKGTTCECFPELTLGVCTCALSIDGNFTVSCPTR
jgi:hypothetical protein